MYKVPWQLLSFTSEAVEIKLELEESYLIDGSLTDPDTLFITFWGTEYFKSEAGVEIT